MGAVALAAAVLGAGGGAAAEPAGTTPPATTPSAPAPAAPGVATAPATTPDVLATTPPACAVSGPAIDDRSAPLRTALPKGLIVIALDRAERKALPNPLPRSVTKRLGDLGAVFGPRDAKGAVDIKSMWRRDRRAAGRLRVTGRRLNQPGGRFRATIDRQYGGRRYSPFVPGGLVFSDVGCWQVDARAGRAQVSYVVLVRRPEPGEFAPHLH